MHLTRRRALLTAIELLATAGLLATVGCGDDDPGGSSSSSGTGGGAAGGGGSGATGGGGGSASGGSGGAGGGGGSAPVDCGDTAISTNHGHALLVPWVDVLAAQDKTYSIQASATHDHQVTVTAADFGQLAGGSSVTLTSTTTAQHSHQVQVSCP